MCILGLKGLNPHYVPGSGGPRLKLTDGLCCLRVSNHMSRNAICLASSTLDWPAFSWFLKADQA